MGQNLKNKNNVVENRRNSRIGCIKNEKKSRVQQIMLLQIICISINVVKDIYRPGGKMKKPEIIAHIKYQVF